MKRQRMGRDGCQRPPPPIGLEEKDWVRWTWRGDESFMERKEETWGGRSFPHPIT